MQDSLARWGLDQLSVEERVALVQAIWDSVAADRAPPPPSAELQAELDRRLAEHEAHPEDAVPWEEVRDAALRRLAP